MSQKILIICFIFYFRNSVLKTLESQFSFSVLWLQKIVFSSIVVYWYICSNTTILYHCLTFRMFSTLYSELLFNIYYQVKWGCDLQSEHERYLTEEAFRGCPVIVRDYPKAWTPLFYFFLIYGRKEKLIMTFNSIYRITVLKHSRHITISGDQSILYAAKWWWKDCRSNGYVGSPGNLSVYHFISIIAAL